MRVEPVAKTFFIGKHVEYVRHITNSEKAGLALGGSGLKYTMWNVERSSLRTDKRIRNGVGHSCLKQVILVRKKCFGGFRYWKKLGLDSARLKNLSL